MTLLPEIFPVCMMLLLSMICILLNSCLVTLMGLHSQEGLIDLADDSASNFLHFIHCMTANIDMTKLDI